MAGHDWFVERRMDFATRALDAPEAESFAAHLAGCDECRREVAAIERDLAWLPMAATPARPSAAFRRRMGGAAAGPARPGFATRAAPWALAASVLLAVAVWGASNRRVDRLTATLAAREARLAALTDTLSVMRQATRVLEASISMDGHQGGMMIFADTMTHRWNVVVHGLPPAPAGEMYQFWFVAQDGMVRGVQLDLRDAHQAIFTVGMPSTGGKVLGAALSVEQVSAHPGPEPGRMLAHLML